MFEIFRIGFLSFTFLDFIDIVIVSILFYKLYTFIKGTIASQIFIGLIIVLVLSFISQAINLKALSWLLKLISDIWIIAFIILFQPEIRRLLVQLAKSPWLRIGVKSNQFNPAEIIAETAFELSQLQHGALIVVVRSSGIRGYVERGIVLNAVLSKELLKSIFYPGSALHDGAVVIKNNIIEAAHCEMPLSQTSMYKDRYLGMRHRAGLGISEQADVVSIIVSEETGAISIADNGVLKTGISKDQLKTTLRSVLQPKKRKNISFLSSIKKNLE